MTISSRGASAPLPSGAATAALQAAPSALYTGTKTIATHGTPAALASTQALKKGVYVWGKLTNTGLAYVGNSAMTAAGGAPLNPGEKLWIDIDDLAKVYVDVDIDTNGVGYSGS